MILIQKIQLCNKTVTTLAMTTQQRTK